MDSLKNIAMREDWDPEATWAPNIFIFLTQLLDSEISSNSVQKLQFWKSFSRKK